MNTAPETTLRFVYARKGSDLNQLRLIGSYPLYNSFHRIGFNIFLVGYRQHFGCLTMAIYQSWFISHHIEHFVGYVPILNLLVIFDFLDLGQHPFIFCLHVFFQDLSIEPLFIQNLSHFSYHMSIIISIFSFSYIYLFPQIIYPNIGVDLKVHVGIVYCQGLWLLHHETPQKFWYFKPYMQYMKIECCSMKYQGRLLILNLNHTRGL